MTEFYLPNIALMHSELTYRTAFDPSTSRVVAIPTFKQPLDIDFAAIKTEMAIRDTAQMLAMANKVSADD